MRSSYWVTLTAAITVVVCALLALGRLPLGIPGQWEWGRWDQPTSWLDWFTVAVLSVVYVGFVRLGACWAGGRAWTTSVALLGLVVAGFAVQTGIQRIGVGLAKWPFVLYSPSSSGYYTAAKQDVQSARQFLTHYDQIQRAYRERYGPLHLATHPPGLVLLHYASLRLCEANPAVTRLLLRMQPEQVADGFREVVPGPPLPPADQASIWLVALGSQLASALVVIPIYFLARRGGGPDAAWWSAALWPLVPAVTIFMPKSDVLYPLFAAASVALAVAGSTAAGRCLAGLAAGVTLCGAMFLSFGLISIVPLVVFAAGLSEWSYGEKGLRSVVRRLTFLILGLSAPIIILWAATGHWLPATWWRCYRIHATFYDPGQVGGGAARTYWPWLAFNLVEFAVATGLPVMAAAIAGTVRLCRQHTVAHHSAPGAPNDFAQHQHAFAGTLAVSAGWWVVLLALDLSGKNRGEIARLWMFFMPFACVAAAPAIEQLTLLGRRGLVVLLLVLQVGQTVAFAAHMQGFYDPSSIRISGETLDGSRIKG